MNSSSLTFEFHKLFRQTSCFSYLFLCPKLVVESNKSHLLSSQSCNLGSVGGIHVWSMCISCDRSTGAEGSSFERAHSMSSKREVAIREHLIQYWPGALLPFSVGLSSWLLGHSNSTAVGAGTPSKCSRRPKRKLQGFL